LLSIQVLQGFPEANGTLPAALYRLVDPSAPVDLPSPGTIKLTPADNRELDKLVAALGRSKATWRRALVLHEWLLAIGHKADDRLCTTLIRVCAQHGQASTALALYDWMRRPVSLGGGGLQCTVYTYTAAMRAALSASHLDRALAVWGDAEADNAHEIDCRLCTTMIEVYARRGETDRAIELYQRMTAAAPGSKLAPTVHAYTAAMRAAAEGGRWEAALAVWDEMRKAGCKPTGHAYSAVISACAAGGEWQRAVALFDEMLGWGVKPDVVSCTSLVTALGADGQWERAEKVVEWMLRNDIRPNVRTYTALVGALATACQWERAVDIVDRMRTHALGPGVEPNAYTYSALLKALGDHGKWKLAEKLFGDLEEEQLSIMQAEAAKEAATTAATGIGPSSSATAPSAMEHGFAASSAVGARRSTATHAEETDDGTESPEERSAAAALVARTAELALGALEEPFSPGTAASSSASSRFEALLEERTSPSNIVGGARHHASTAHATPGFSYFSSASADGAAATPTSAQSTAIKDKQPVSDTTTGSLSPSSMLDRQGGKEDGIAQPFDGAASAVWTTENAAIRGLHLDLNLHATTAATLSTRLPGQEVGPSISLNVWNVNKDAATTAAHDITNTARATPIRAPPKGRGVVNEVVCGALMLAYERAGKWQQAVGVLDRARALGIVPNTVMYNTAISALGKARQLEAAKELFDATPSPDAVTYETMIAAYGMAGEPEAAEQVLATMQGAGHAPQDFAFCGLIAAYSLKGDYKAALAVKSRAAEAGIAPTVHMYNALIAACDRSQHYEQAVALSREMGASGVAPNGVTRDLLDSVCKEGVRVVENQQAAIAALSAAVAAAGTVMMRAGLF
jgi:pentatricopeptide repeat protein